MRPFRGLPETLRCADKVLSLYTKSPLKGSIQKQKQKQKLKQKWVPTKVNSKQDSSFPTLQQCQNV